MFLPCISTNLCITNRSSLTASSLLFFSIDPVILQGLPNFQIRVKIISDYVAIDMITQLQLVYNF